MDCSLENDESSFLIQQSSAQQNKAASNNLDKPFGMDLSVEFGGHSNRSSVASQVRKFMEDKFDVLSLTEILFFQDIKSPDITSHK